MRIEERSKVLNEISEAPSANAANGPLEATAFAVSPADCAGVMYCVCAALPTPLVNAARDDREAYFIERTVYDARGRERRREVQKAIQEWTYLPRHR